MITSTIASSKMSLFEQRGEEEERSTAFISAYYLLFGNFRANSYILEDTIWVVLTFSISWNFPSGHAGESSFPFGDVLVMSNAVGGRLWQKNQFLPYANVESNLKLHQCKMTTAIKSKDLVVLQRGIIKMSFWPTELYIQQVSAQ